MQRKGKEHNQNAENFHEYRASRVNFLIAEVILDAGLERVKEFRRF
jgi:hypothetical protein